MSAQEIVAELPKLTAADRQLVAARLQALEANDSPVPRSRLAGLQAGTVAWVADDFDAPLPDELWLGSDA